MLKVDVIRSHKAHERLDEKAQMDFEIDVDNRQKPRKQFSLHQIFLPRRLRGGVIVANPIRKQLIFAGMREEMISPLRCEEHFGS